MNRYLVKIGFIHNHDFPIEEHKVTAIKELKAITGLSLRHSHQIVTSWINTVAQTVDVIVTEHTLGRFYAMDTLAEREHGGACGIIHRKVTPTLRIIQEWHKHEPIHAYDTEDLT